jgi:hypothetical protein
MRRRYLTASIATAVLLCAPAAQAADPLAGGTARLKPAREVSVALVSRGVTIERRSFDISGGAITSGHAAGAIALAGGLTFRGASASLAATRLEVRLGPRSALTGLVREDRVRLLALDATRARVVRRGLDTRITGVRTELTSVASRALNRTFDTSRFKTGMNVGMLSITAKPASVAVKSGRTSFALDPGMGQALQTLEIGVAPSALGLRVGGGRLDRSGTQGSVGHAEGASLEFRRGNASIELADVVVRLGKRPRVLGRFGEDRLTFANLDPAAVKPVLNGRRFTLEGIPAVLTTSAAKALNQAFGTTAFTTGAPFGTATVKATAA